MIEYAIDTVLSDVLYSVEYIAAITGADPNFVLHRDFLSSSMGGGGHGREEYVVTLDTGVYEVSYAVHSCDTCEQVFRTRTWVVVLDNEAYTYPYEEMNAQYALYTLFCLLVQTTSLLPWDIIRKIYNGHLPSYW